jgi:DNA-directed RNA polymerase specialized sigma24 family protein
MRFDFTKTEYNYLKEELMLNEEYAAILELKIKGYSLVEISMELNISTATVSRRLKEIRKKIKKVVK